MIDFSDILWNVTLVPKVAGFFMLNVLEHQCLSVT